MHAHELKITRSQPFPGRPVLDYRRPITQGISAAFPCNRPEAPIEIDVARNVHVPVTTPVGKDGWRYVANTAANAPAAASHSGHNYGSGTGGNGVQKWSAFLYFNTETVAANDNLLGCAEAGSAATHGWSIWLNTATPKLRFGRGAGIEDCGSTTIAAGEHTILAVFNLFGTGGFFAIYVDGALSQSVSTSNAIAYSGTPLFTIGTGVIGTAQAIFKNVVIWENRLLGLGDAGILHGNPYLMYKAIGPYR